MSLVARELRIGRRERQRLARKIACARLAGVVTAVRKQDGRWQVRLVVGEDPQTGRQVLSPWVRITTVAAGDVKVAVKPAVGQRMHLVSASGVVGGDSVAEWGSYDDELNQPDGDEDVVITRGESRIEMTDERVRTRVGASRVTVRDEEIVAERGESSCTVRADFVRGRRGDARFVASNVAKIRAGGSWVVASGGDILVSSLPIIGADPDPH